jgi:hypothetical protein
MVNHPNRSVLPKDFPSDVLPRLEALVTDMEVNLVNILAGYQKGSKDPVYAALEAAMVALGNARGVIQERTVLSRSKP